MISIRRLWLGLSVERKLPLLVGGLLVAVVLALSGAAYEEMRRASRVTAATRIERTTAAWADLLQRSTPQRLAETRSLAANPALAALLAARGRAGRPAALQALRRIAAESAPNIAIEVQDAAGQVLLRSGDPLLHAGPPPPVVGDSGEVGKLGLVRDSVLQYEVRATVRDGGRSLGQVVQLRRIVLSEQSRQNVRQLLGHDLTLFLGNADGPPWTDLATLVPTPAAAVRARRDAVEYERDGLRFGATAPLPGTPWLVLVELPHAEVYATANRHIGRMALVALGIVLLGGLGAWWISRRVTRPIRRLTTAAEAVAAGDLTQRVAITGTDEVGRLAGAFNTMAEQVARAQHGLEAQVADRTRELEAAQQRLQQTSEERYRTLFAESPLPMWLYDPDTLRFLDVNEAAVRHYGYTRDQFLAMTIKDIRPPEDVPRLLEAIAQAANGLSDAGVFRHRTRDGTVIEVDVTRHRLELAGRSVVLVLANDITARRSAERALLELNAQLDARVAERTSQLETANRKLAADVTERRKAEEAARVSEERFRALAETANDAIVSADSRGVIRYFNRAAEKIFGYPASVAVGQPLTLLMPARLRDGHRAGFARFLETGQARVVGKTVELAGQRRDGSEFPVELSLACWRTAAGPSFTGILRDITERKRIAEQIATDAEALERANKELEAFSYSVSHDLRAPLRAIHGFARILIEEHASALAEEPRRLLAVIDDNTRRMGQLIDDLLAFSRLGRKEIAAAHVDMTELAQAVAAELQVSAAVERLPAARGDRALLRQAITNLLQNAVKFTRGRPDPRIEVGTGPDEDGKRVYYVRDNGVGFDMRYAGKLFGVFQRLHSDAEFEGTGVGLATVQRIIHRHGGRVWAEGKVGEGATFFFTIPGSGEV